MNIDELDDATAVASLKSELCPACGKAKNVMHTLCARDYRRLPGHLRTALYRRVGEGYLEAVKAALEALEALQPQLGAS